MDDGSANLAAIGQSRRLTTVVAADICGYSRLAEIDDAAAVRTVHIVRAAFEGVVAKRRGRLFHSSGDGFLAEFPSAADGVLAALDFVADIRARDSLSPTSPGAKVRAGVHSGDVMEQPGGDLLGHGVNIAARLQGEAAPNGVLVSQATVNLVRTSVEAEFHRRGALTLKNIEEPVVAFEAANTAQKLKYRFGRAAIATTRGAVERASTRRISIFGLSATFVLVIGSALSGSSIWSLRQTGQPTRAEAEKALDDLTNKISGKNLEHTDEVELLSLKNAAASLLASDVPEKAQAIEFIRNGNFDEAVRLLEGVYERQLSSSTRQSAQIKTLHEIGAIQFNVDTPQAIKTYEKIREKIGNDPLILYQLGRLYARQNNAIRAASTFRLLSLSPNTSDVMKARSRIGQVRAKLALGLFEGLESEIAEIVAQASSEGLIEEHSDALSVYATFLDFTDRDSAALEVQRKAIEIAKGLGEEGQILSANAKYGAMLLEAGQLYEAKKVLTDALVLAEKDEDGAALGGILYNLALLSLEQDDSDAAAQFAERAYKLAQQENRPNLIALSADVIRSSKKKQP